MCRTHRSTEAVVARAGWFATKGPFPNPDDDSLPLPRRIQIETPSQSSASALSFYLLLPRPFSERKPPALVQVTVSSTHRKPQKRSEIVLLRSFRSVPSFPPSNDHPLVARGTIALPLSQKPS